ncbi:MAG: hypothetical protein ACK5HA_17560 [Planctomycetaceae bacterium]
MLLQATDYQFARLSQSLAGVWQLLGDWETRWARRRLAGVQLDRPVFLTGLARSGTTILLEELSKRPGVATHRYRDFPFLMTPLCWNWYLDRFQTGGEPVERPHKDRIHITPASPEAFEEPIWRHFFPQWRDPNAGHAVTAACQHPAFEAFYRDHLKKIVSLRGGATVPVEGELQLHAAGVPGPAVSRRPVPGAGAGPGGACRFPGAAAPAVL